jgi:hypothetical protein
MGTSQWQPEADWARREFDAVWDKRLGMEFEKLGRRNSPPYQVLLKFSPANFEAAANALRDRIRAIASDRVDQEDVPEESAAFLLGPLRARALSVGTELVASWKAQAPQTPSLLDGSEAEARRRIEATSTSVEQGIAQDLGAARRKAVAANLKAASATPSWVDRRIEWFRNHSIFGPLILLAIILGAVLGFATNAFDNATKLWELCCGDSRHVRRQEFYRLGKDISFLEGSLDRQLLIDPAIAKSKSSEAQSILTKYKIAIDLSGQDFRAPVGSGSSDGAHNIEAALGPVGNKKDVKAYLLAIHIENGILVGRKKLDKSKGTSFASPVFQTSLLLDRAREFCSAAALSKFDSSPTRELVEGDLSVFAPALDETVRDCL